MIVDTNVIITLIEADGDVSSLKRQFYDEPARCINEIVFAEFAGRYDRINEPMDLVHALGLSIERLTLDECHRAGLAFREYRRRGGTRTSILPDFLIGAQASMRGWPILTADRKGFASYFPDVVLIDPQS